MALRLCSGSRWASQRSKRSLPASRCTAKSSPWDTTKVVVFTMYRHGCGYASRLRVWLLRIVGRSGLLVIRGFVRLISSASRAVAAQVFKDDIKGKANDTTDNGAVGNIEIGPVIDIGDTHAHKVRDIALIEAIENIAECAAQLQPQEDTQEALFWFQGAGVIENGGGDNSGNHDKEIALILENAEGRAKVMHMLKN